MALHIVRFSHQDHIKWGWLQNGKIAAIDLPCTTTCELIKLGYSGIQKLAVASTHFIDSSEATLLSPITESSKVLCQGANYRQHMIDSGMNPDAKAFNMFFTKSSASITNPTGHIVKPSHVQLLDYEIELTLVLSKQTNSSVKVNKDNLHEYVAGICIGNDVSARDIQIPQMQFHKGKSYRTFCPLGPVLCLLDKNEMHYLDAMQLTLTVNGETRQNDNTANLVYKPAEAISEFSQIQNFEPGDVLMTGTPSGCALGLPSPMLVRITGLLPEATKWALFKKIQLKRDQYLQVGDIVECRITSRDGKIDLGIQHHAIVSGEA